MQCEDELVDTRRHEHENYPPFSEGGVLSPIMLAGMVAPPISPDAKWLPGP